MKGRKPLPTAAPKPGQMTPAPGRPARPPHVTGEAAAEWDRLAEELDLAGVLTTADRGALAMYCIAWARWVKATEQVAKLGEIVAAPKTKVPMPNPWLPVANKAHEQMAKLGAEFGLTPSSRCRISTPEQTKDAPDFDLD